MSQASQPIISTHVHSTVTMCMYTHGNMIHYTCCEICWNEKYINIITVPLVNIYTSGLCIIII